MQIFVWQMGEFCELKLEKVEMWYILIEIYKKNDRIFIWQKMD